MADEIIDGGSVLSWLCHHVEGTVDAAGLAKECTLGAERDVVSSVLDVLSSAVAIPLDVVGHVGQDPGCRGHCCLLLCPLPYRGSA